MTRLFNTLVDLAPNRYNFTLLALQSRTLDTVKRVRFAVMLPLLRLMGV